MREWEAEGESDAGVYRKRSGKEIDEARNGR